MVYKKKSWQDKLADNKKFPKILKLERNFPCYKALHKMGVEKGEMVVLVNASEIIEIIKEVPRGKLITLVEICRQIARKHHVQGCCSLTTGIYITVIANAVEEEANQGKDLVIPYWRTLKSNGFLNEKYPEGLEGHKKLLEKEGFKILQKGKKCLVENYQKYLIGSN
jgi:alkylated DNA nucleotide flippase Atl1